MHPHTVCLRVCVCLNHLPESINIPREKCARNDCRLLAELLPSPDVMPSVLMFDAVQLACVHKCKRLLSFALHSFTLLSFLLTPSLSPSCSLTLLLLPSLCDLVTADTKCHHSPKKEAAAACSSTSPQFL